MMKPKCIQGYQMNKLGDCKDIDECKVFKSCKLNEECINLKGNYECHMKNCSQPGYHFNIATMQCEDIDE